MTAEPVVLSPPAPAPPKPPATKASHSVTLWGREIPVVPPSIRDIRFRLTAIIIGIQVCGQTVLRFKVSISQIVVSMLVCGIIELAVTLWREQRIVWPASAFQTGASVAFILRANGTLHGDLWSFHGMQYFVLASVISMLSKYLIRPDGKRHLFNPSNVGIIAVLLVVGPNYVFSEHLWWAPFGLRLLLPCALILFGGYWIAKAVKMVPMATAFLATFGVLTALFALHGRSFYATWRTDPISGSSYWLNIAFSPEVWAFVFFMMSDPQTAPKSRQGRILYGIFGAVLTAGLLYPQTTEFGIKVALIGSLTVACALTPFIERLLTVIHDRRTRAAVEGRPERRPLLVRLATAMRVPAVLAAAIIAIAVPLDTGALVADHGIVLVERNLPAPGTVPGNTPAHNPYHQ